MATHGSLGEFDPRTGDWKTYIERAQQYFLANDVDDADKQRAILLSCVGSKAYRIIKDVLSPDAPTDVELPTLIEKTSKHFQPEPSEIPFPYSRTRVARIGRNLHCPAETNRAELQFRRNRTSQRDASRPPGVWDRP